MRKILVTGASGFIGTNLCKFLSSKNFSIKGISHSNQTEKFPKISLLNLTQLNTFFKKNHFDTVIHLASLIENDDPLKIQNVNYDITMNLLNCCVRNKVPNFIFASSHLVYGKTNYLPIDENHSTNPQTPYGISKLIGENLCKLFHNNFDLNTIILRISSVYGKNQPKSKLIPNFILRSKQSKSLLLHNYTNGYQLMDMIHVDDVSNSFYCAIKSKRKFGLYNIATGNSITVEDIAAKINNIKNSELLIKNVSKKTDHFLYNTKKAKTELKFSSKIKFENVIKKLYRDINENN